MTGRAFTADSDWVAGSEALMDGDSKRSKGSH